MTVTAAVPAGSLVTVSLERGTLTGRLSRDWTPGEAIGLANLPPRLDLAGAVLPAERLAYVHVLRRARVSR